MTRESELVRALRAISRKWEDAVDSAIAAYEQAGAPQYDWKLTHEYTSLGCPACDLTNTPHVDGQVVDDPRKPADKQRAPEPLTEYCDNCDGCGWYEGGKTLQTTCEKCKGTGVIRPAEPKETE